MEPVNIIHVITQSDFKYVRFYEEATHLIGTKNWHGLKDKLQTDPKRVIPAVLAYQQTMFATKVVEQELNDHVLRCHPRTDDYPYLTMMADRYKITQDLHKHRVLEKERFDILQNIVYG